MLNNMFEKGTISDGIKLIRFNGKNGKKYALEIGIGTHSKIIELSPLTSKPKTFERYKDRVYQNKNRLYEKELYQVWRFMFVRCYRPRNFYEQLHYQLKGVRVCEAWHNFDNFYDWAIENGYTNTYQKDFKKKLTIDRIDGNGNYEPTNCRWVNLATQNSNKSYRAFGIAKFSKDLSKCQTIPYESLSIIRQTFVKEMENYGIKMVQ